MQRFKPMIFFRELLMMFLVCCSVSIKVTHTHTQRERERERERKREKDIPYPSARAGCDTRLMSKRCLTVLTAEFPSFRQLAKTGL